MNSSLAKSKSKTCTLHFSLSELQRALAIRSEDDGLPEQRQELEERLNLLSEENQVLFEQSEAYRIQFQALTKSYEDRMKELGEKIGRHDTVQEECDLAVSQLQEAKERISFLEKKMGDLVAEVVCDLSDRMGDWRWIHSRVKEK
jgi:chromosome segregation ATPase